MPLVLATWACDGAVVHGLLLDTNVVSELRKPRPHGCVSLPLFQGQCLESCFYTDPMKTNDHNECPFYASPLQR